MMADSGPRMNGPTGNGSVSGGGGASIATINTPATGGSEGGGHNLHQLGITSESSIIKIVLTTELFFYNS